MSAPAGAMLAIWHDVEPDFVAEYLRWHSFEHLPERLALPGFLRATRYECEEGPDPRFACFIDVRDLADFSAPDYVARLNAPTPWTRALMPRYGRIMRALCRIVFQTGSRDVAPLGGCIRFDLPGAADALERTLAKLHGEMAIVQAQLAQTDAALTSLESEEKRLRRKEDTGGYGHLLLITALEPAGLRHAMQAIGHRLTEFAAPMTASTYRLSYAATSAYQADMGNADEQV